MDFDKGIKTNQSLTNVQNKNGLSYGHLRQDSHNIDKGTISTTVATTKIDNTNKTYQNNFSFNNTSINKDNNSSIANTHHNHTNTNNNTNNHGRGSNRGAGTNIATSVSVPTKNSKAGLYSPTSETPNHQIVNGSIAYNYEN